jgi:hypothetical protein
MAVPPASRTAAVLLAGAAALSLGLGACNKKHNEAKPKTSSTAPTVSTTSTSIPAGCKKLRASALSSAAGRKVELNKERSSPDLADPSKGYSCSFSEPGQPVVYGSVAVAVYGSAKDARAQYDQGSNANAQLGIAPTPEKHGDAAYSIPQGNAYTCTVLKGSTVVTATVAGTSSKAACAWADEAIKNLT